MKGFLKRMQALLMGAAFVCSAMFPDMAYAQESVSSSDADAYEEAAAYVSASDVSGGNLVLKERRVEIIASAAGYTEGGASASKTAAQNALDNAANCVRVKYTDGTNHSFSRRSYFQFDIKGLDLDGRLARMNLVLQKDAKMQALSSTYYAGAVEADLNTLAWQDWGVWQEPADKVPFTVEDNFSAATAGSVISVDVTGLVAAAKAEGKDTVTLCVYVPARAQDNGLEIYSLKAEPENQPRLVIAPDPDDVSPPEPCALDYMDNASFTREGTWEDGTNGLVEKTNMTSSAAGSTVQFTFTGTKAYLMGAMGPGNGKLSVSIDGGEAVTADTYWKEEQQGQVLFASQDLEDGRHQVTVTVLGEKNEASTGTKVDLDAVYFINNGGKGLFEFESGTAQVRAGETLSVNIRRVGGSKGEASIVVQDYPGTAVQGQYYQTITERLTFADGETMKSVAVPTFVSPAQTEPLNFVLQLENGSEGSGAAMMSGMEVTLNLAESVQIISITEVRVETEAGTPPVLPEEVDVAYNDGSKGKVSVTWELDGVSFGKPGEVAVFGTVADTELKAAALIDVKKANQTNKQKIQSGQDIYVQGGAHANLTPSQYTSAPVYVPEELRIKNSNSNQAYTRRVYINYDLGGMTDDFHRAELKFRWKKQETQWNTSDVYLLEDPVFREDTITWNNAPAHAAGRLTTITPQDVQDEVVTVDVTEAVKQALEGGKNSIGFLIENGSSADTNGLTLYSSRAQEEYRPYMSAYQIDISKIPDVRVNTMLGTAPVLPDEVTVHCFDGATRTEKVVWEEIAPDSYASVGSFNVSGKLKDYLDLTVKALVTVEMNEDYEGTAYYVSSTEGDDGNDGLTPETAWASLDKVNSHAAFLPGDQILLKKGDVWNGYLRPQGSGVEGKPIILSSYGEGDADLRPVINGGGTDYYWLSGTVMLSNQEYWEISGLEVTNIGEGETWGAPNTNITARAGIMISTDDQDDIKDHIYIRDCYVHEVNSFTQFISERQSKIGGITLRAGNTDPDLNPVAPVNKAGFNHVRVENNIVIRSCIEGIRNAGGINTDIAFRNNYIQDVVGDGIVMANGDGTVNIVEKNVVVRPASKAPHSGAYYAGVWVWNTDDVLFQYNAVYGTLFGSGDGEAFDADQDSARTIFQYNYSQYNSGGVCLFMQRQTDTVFRYNVSVNDGWRSGEEILNAHSLPGNDANTVPDIYNNTFYVGKNTNLFGATSGNRFARFRNNIVIIGDGVSLQFNKANLSASSMIENNIFWYEGQDKQAAYDRFLARSGKNQAAMEAAGNLFTDPMLRDPKGALGHYSDGDSLTYQEARQLLETDLVERLRGQASKFEPMEGSPAVGGGTPIILKPGYPANVDRDIMGRPVDPDKPAIGALEPEPTLEAPVFTKDLPARIEVKEDGRIELSITAAGKGEISFQWYKDGAVIPGAAGETYVITEAGKDAAGEYRVRATASLGQLTAWTDSAACTLTVSMVPRYGIEVSVRGGNGEVTVDKTLVKAGEKVVISFMPEDGYQTGSVYVNGKALEGPFGSEYELTVEEDIAVTVVFDKIQEPTEEPTTDPTTEPTEDPSTDPTTEPTEDPSTDPTTDPTGEPGTGPTAEEPSTGDSAGAGDTAEAGNDDTDGQASDGTSDATSPLTMDGSQDSGWTGGAWVIVLAVILGAAASVLVIFRKYKDSEEDM